jgi:hypothetical protein
MDMSRTVLDWALAGAGFSRVGPPPAPWRCARPGRALLRARFPHSSPAGNGATMMWAASGVLSALAQPADGPGGPDQADANGCFQCGPGYLT